MRILIAAPGHSVSTVDVYTGYLNALKAMGHEVSGFDYHLRLAFYDVAIEAWLKRNENFKAGPAEKFLLASEALAIEAFETRVLVGRHPDDPSKLKSAPVPPEIVARFMQGD